MLTRTLPDWAICLFAGVVVAVGVGLAAGLGQSRLAAGLINGVGFGIIGAVGVALLLRRSSRFEPVQAARLRASLPLAVVAGTVPAAVVMGIMFWFLDRN